MTSAPAAIPDAASTRERPLAWGDHAFHFAGVIAGYPDYNRGELADLRRMDPDNDTPAVLWRLLASRDLLDNANREVERKWALILHGIALMTRTAGSDASARSAHSRTPVGRALYQGGESARGSGFYSETRFNRLLNAREDMLRVLLARMFRMAASAGVTFNWWEMAQFIRNSDFDEDAAEASRRRLAREYYTAQRRTAAAQSDSTDG